MGGRGDVGGGVEEFEDALGGGHGGLEDVVLLAQVHDGAEETLGVLDEGDEDAEGDGAVEGGQTAAPDDKGDGDRGEELDGGVVEGVGEDGVFEGVHVLPVDGGEVVVGARFAVEELDDAHAGDVLLHVGVDVGDGGADAAVGVADVAAEDAGDVEDGGNDGEGEEGERPAHAEHDEDDEEEDEDVFKDGKDAGGEHLVDGVDVGGDAGDEAADGVAVEEGGLHALDVGKDFAAHVEHDFLAGPLHEVGLEELEQVGEGQGGEVEKGALRDAAGGGSAELAGEPGELVEGNSRHVAVDGDLDQEGPEDVGAGLEQDGEGGEGGLELIRGEVGQEPAHEAAVVGLADDVIVILGWRGLCLLLGFRGRGRGILLLGLSGLGLGHGLCSV